MEFVTARISCIQFAQRYVMCIYGGRITFVLFAPVPETGCPMWHAGLTLTLTLLCLCIHVFHVSKFECSVFFFVFFAAVLPKFKCWHRTGTELLDFSATFLQHKNFFFALRPPESK